jgi:hypothetical protein
MLVPTKLDTTGADDLKRRSHSPWIFASGETVAWWRLAWLC